MLYVIGYEESWGHRLIQTGFHHLDLLQGMQLDTLITALEIAPLGHGLALAQECVSTGWPSLHTMHPGFEGILLGLPGT